MIYFIIIKGGCTRTHHWSLLTYSVSVIVLGHVAIAAQPSAKNVLDGVMIAMPISRLVRRTPSSATIRAC